MNTRPLNDRLRTKSVFEIKRDFKHEEEMLGKIYFAPETSAEVRYQITEVSVEWEKRLLWMEFEDIDWKGPMYVMFFQEGKCEPLKVVSVMPDNIYMEIGVLLPEVMDRAKGCNFVLLSNVEIAGNEKVSGQWTTAGPARWIKQLNNDNGND